MNFCTILLALQVQSQGSWTNIGSSGVVCIHTFLLPKNRIVCVERPHELPYPPNPNTGGLLSTEIDLQGGGEQDGEWIAKYTPIPILNNPFCGGHASMADGSILVVGGDNRSISLIGSDEFQVVNGRQGMRIYHPCDIEANPGCVGTWDIKPSMSSERWYPTVVTLGDGSNVIFGGSRQNLDFDHLNISLDNPTYEYYPPKNGRWPRDLELLRWAYPHNLYPQSFLLPSGKVFLLASNRSIILDPSNEYIEELENMPNTKHSPWVYPATPSMFIKPITRANNWAFELMICGGSEAGPVNIERDRPASSQCLSIRPDDPSPEWKIEENLPSPRLMPDSVILADGTVLVVNGLKFGQAGGNQGQVQYAYEVNYSADLYDPRKKEGSRWSTVTGSNEKRLYHSGALLLETGHVITTGSEMNNYDDFWTDRRAECHPNPDGKECTDAFNYNISRYSPPYLDNVASKGRPVIINAPLKVTHGSLIPVDVDSTDLIDQFSFIRMATTTHSTNTDQRYIELKLKAKTKTTFYIRIPESTGQAPPGNWFLFALRNDGVPSIAKTINLRSGKVVEAFVPADAVPISSSLKHFPSLTLFFGLAMII
jgi:hypothetical protein